MLAQAPRERNRQSDANEGVPDFACETRGPDDLRRSRDPARVGCSLNRGGFDIDARRGSVPRTAGHQT